MADDYTFKDSAGTSRTLRATDLGSGKLAPWRIQAGALNLVCATANISTSAATLVVARPTRRQVTIKNMDAAILVYVGPATVSSANGYALKPGESIALTYPGLIQAIAASGTPSVSVADEYY